jgi:hypothetical protein
MIGAPEDEAMLGRTRNWTRRTALAGAVLLGVSSGCGGEETSEAEAPDAPAAAASAPAAPVAPAAAPLRQPPPPAAASAQAGAAPAEPRGSAGIDLPQDVPLYPGAEVSEVAGDTPGNQSVIFLTPDPSDRVADHLFGELRRSDWVVQQNKAEDGQALFAEKDSRSLAVMVHDRGDQGSEISVLVLDAALIPEE